MGPMDPSATRRLAERQAGVLSRRQLRELGLSDQQVKDGVGSGRFVRIYRGVYALGHGVLTPRGWWWAGVLRGGEGAVLGVRSAAALLGLRAHWPPPVEVVGPKRIRQAGLVAHRHRLHRLDVTTRDRLPVTTVARTLVDLADVLDERGLEHAYDSARVKRLLDPRALQATLGRAHGRHGAPKLQAIVAADRPPALTNGVLEEAFLRLVRAARLPDPQVNRQVHGHRVDFQWPAHRLIVEVDGATTHANPRGRRRDHRRDARHLLGAWRTVRFVYEDVVEDPGYVVATLRSLML